MAKLLRPSGLPGVQKTASSHTYCSRRESDLLLLLLVGGFKSPDILFSSVTGPGSSLYDS